MKQIISSPDHPDIQIEIKFNPNNSSRAGGAGGGGGEPLCRPPPPQDGGRREWCQTPEINGNHQLTDTYRQRSSTFGSGTSPSLAHRRGADAKQAAQSGQSPAQAAGDRSWRSDSEDTMSWLDQQRMKLTSKRQVDGGEKSDRIGPDAAVVNEMAGQQRAWMVNRTKQECALVAELKSAQKSLLKKHTESSSQPIDGSSSGPYPGANRSAGARDGRLKVDLAQRHMTLAEARHNFLNSSSSASTVAETSSTQSRDSRSAPGQGRSVTPGRLLSGEDGGRRGKVVNSVKLRKTISFLESSGRRSRRIRPNISFV